MSQLKEIYNLKEDDRKIKIYQEASLDKNPQIGLKIEDDLLFGTKKWFVAIENGRIKKHIVKGIISNVLISGNNDYPEFEINNNNNNVTTWDIEGIISNYKTEKNVCLTYVEQKYKRPSDITGSISRCVIQIKIEQ